jgi:hypothetical protein
MSATVSAAARSLTRATMTAHSTMRMDSSQEEKCDEEEELHF